jgi:uncharacterized protein (DUF488 family)
MISDRYSGHGIEMTTTLFTVGYEGRAQHDVLRLLTQEAIELLVDVRIRAQSRKPGFSKSTLAAGLGAAGIDYLHLRALGTPLEIRAEFRAHNTQVAREAYRQYLIGDPEASDQLEQLASLARARPTAILCFEHDPRACHRMVIAEELEQRHGIGVRHLGVPETAP